MNEKCMKEITNILRKVKILKKFHVITQALPNNKETRPRGYTIKCLI